MIRACIVSWLVAMGLVGCSSGRYPAHGVESGVELPGSVNRAIAPAQLRPAAWVAAAIAGDGPGSQAPISNPSAVPVSNLPKSARGNPSEYTVGGVRYGVIDNAAGFAEQGHASWYGRKFHGRETSSGERYDMYKMTAAHKHLPLPTFVRVTRTDTGQSIVVKVNDRGPFVPGRIIDLSYQAASTLGIVDAGTAPVLVEALSTHLPEGTSTTADSGNKPAGAELEVAVEPAAQTTAALVAAAKPVPNPGSYLQLGAFRESANARSLAGEIAEHLSDEMPVLIDHDMQEAIFRVWVGPIQTVEDRDSTVAALQARGVTHFTMITRTH